MGDLALGLLGEMSRRGSHCSMVAYNVAVAACSTCVGWHQALSLIRLIRRAFQEPDAMAYHAVVGACESSQQGLMVLELLSSLECKVVPSQCWSPLRHACVER